MGFSSFWPVGIPRQALAETLRGLGAADVLDIAIVSVLLYVGLLGLTQARAARVARGVGLLIGLYFVASRTGMVLTTSIFHRFFTVLLLALVVIFQEELRRFFERLSFWPLPASGSPAEYDIAEPIAQAAMAFALNKIGAIIVVRGRDALERHLQGGHRLGGELCRPLLESLFDPHSDGHDGAVIIEGHRVTHFGVHLPLSHTLEQIAGRGTRHAAALGLSEVTDALCLVVSEQRGAVSIARHGHLTGLANSRKGLEAKILSFLEEKSLSPARRAWWTLLAQHAGMKSLSAVLSVGLWLVFVQGFKPIEQSFRVPVRVHVPGGHLRIEEIRPSAVTITLSGLSRDFAEIKSATPRVALDLEDAEPGSLEIPLTPEDIDMPDALHLVQVTPASIRVTLSRPAPVARSASRSGAMPASARSRRSWFSGRSSGD